MRLGPLKTLLKTPGPVNPNDEHPPILIVDDTDDDVFLLKHALQALGVKNRHVVFSDGTEVLTYLKGVCAMAHDDGPPLPAMMFLDLRMPRVGGFEVLEWIGEQPELSDLPVVVLSTSTLEADQQKSLALGAVAYLIKYPKPSDLATLLAPLRESRPIIMGRC